MYLSLLFPSVMAVRELSCSGPGLCYVHVRTYIHTYMGAGEGGAEHSRAEQSTAEHKQFDWAASGRGIDGGGIFK